MFSRISPWSFPLIVRSSCWAPSLHILLFQMSALAFSHYFFGFDPYHPSIFKINCLGKIIFFQAWSRMELLSLKKKKNEPLLELLFIGCHDQFRLLGFCALTQTIKRPLQDVGVSWLGVQITTLDAPGTPVRCSDLVGKRRREAS